MGRDWTVRFMGKGKGLGREWVYEYLFSKGWS